MSWLEEIGAAVGGWLASTEVLRAASDELRGLMPIVRLGERVIVLRHDDVFEVLSNDRQAFGVAEIYALKMERTTGRFFLGMDDGAQYRREAALARGAVHSADAPRIAQLVSSAADELLAKARPRGTIDAVNDYARRIPLRLLASYFGTPGPDEDTLKRWMRAIFWDIFLNPGDEPTVIERAGVAAAELAPYLDGLIAERRRSLEAGRVVPDDFVTRLVRQQRADTSIDDDLIRRNVGGIIVGAVDTQSKAIVHCIDQLLRQPVALASARVAARAGNAPRVAAHVWEALRFNPHNPVLFRHCVRNTVLARGTDRATEVVEGTTVVAVTLSAMFDPLALPSPSEFSTARLPSSYLHFGHGQHTCFGERINRIVVPLAVAAILRLESLRYDEVGSGAIEYEGPFPDRMQLSFDVER